jgi:hypothetical protein
MLPRPRNPSLNPLSVPAQARRGYFPGSSGGSKVTRVRDVTFELVGPSVAHGGESR